MVKFHVDFFNDCSLILDALPVTSLPIDACDVGAGAYCEGDWIYCNWSADCRELEDEYINLKELAAIVLTIQRWDQLWPNKRVFVWSDNTTTVSSINRCSSRSPLLRKCLRYVFWLSPIYNFRLTASYIPGIQNALADKIPRLHEPHSVHCLQDILAASPLTWHMSLNSFTYLRNRSWRCPGFPGCCCEMASGAGVCIQHSHDIQFSEQVIINLLPAGQRESGTFICR